ncbi:hypothetical protein [Pseudonocardia sp. D17]|uniref:hypothetical protein n=1 Tax=Pseudonocardia sp. D17 TaxID=882661 RepID=UPI002B37FDDC|nr:hypothetical protein PSD17_39370 [Pseudonocardia sp. D17]
MTALGESVSQTHDEHIATVAALVALDHLVDADERGDEPAAQACLDKVMTEFVFRKAPSAAPYPMLAATRLAILCGVLVRQTADRLTADACPDHQYGIRRIVGGRTWDTLDAHDQVALGAVVTAMNGQWNDAHQLLYRYALATGPSAMTQTFVSLLAMRRDSRDERPRPM